MGRAKLKEYDCTKLLKEKDLTDIGCGSSASVKLFYSEELKQYVVGKFFYAVDNRAK